MNRHQRRIAKATGAWTPLQEGVYRPLTDEQVAEAARVTGKPAAEIRASMEEEGALPVWINDTYQVQVRQCGDWTHLNIRRRDGAPIFRDWRHFQNIKNQLCGNEREAIELYPAESRLVDTSNKYHLWVAPAGMQFPIGFDKRDVIMEDSDHSGFKQRAG